MNDNPVIILICAKEEWEAVKKTLKVTSVKISPFGEYFELRKKDFDRKIISFYTGCGKVNASAATQYVIDNYNPEFLINLGTCGGFEGEVKTEEIFTVTETIIYDIIEEGGKTNETLERYRTKLDISWVDRDLFPVYTPTIMVSADKDAEPADISNLKEKYNAIAADWESASIAYVAKRNKIKCLIYRGVSDIVGGKNSIGEKTSSVMKKLIDDLKLSHP